MADDLDPNPADLNPDPDPAPDPQPDPAPDPAPDPEPEPSGDWRAELAGDDEKLAKFLGKYPTSKALAAAAKTLNDRLMQRAASKLPENPTDEELAAYRTEQGVPEKPDGYLDKLPSGLVVGDDDRPAVDTFLSSMHELNAPKPIVDAALGAYYKILEDQQAVEVDRIAEAKETSINSLRDEWGPDYKRNLNAVDAFLKSVPADVAEALTNGVDASGIPLANSASMIQWLAGLALEANPLSTIVPGGNGNVTALADEIAKLEGLMQNKQSEYWVGPNSEKNRTRLRELYAAREKIEAK